MVNSSSVFAIMSITCSPATTVKFDNSFADFDFLSHNHCVSSYNKLNMSKNGECAEALISRGLRTWLI